MHDSVGGIGAVNCRRHELVTSEPILRTAIDLTTRYRDGRLPGHQHTPFGRRRRPQMHGCCGACMDGRREPDTWKGFESRKDVRLTGN